MPNIPQYEARGEITPSDKGIQAAEVAGRRIGSFYNQIGDDFKQSGQQVEQHMAVMETSELYKTGTQLKLNLQQKYDQESALPENRNNPHFADQFMAEVGPQLDQWGSGALTSHGKELAGTLKANIRNEIFNHAASGQSAMDAANVHDNLTQTRNTLGSGLLTNPTAANLNTTLGTMSDAIDGMTMAIPDVRTREEVRTSFKAEALPQLVVARYQGVAESIKSQVAQTGDVTKSPAYDQMGKDIATQVGFQYLPPETQARLTAARDEAVRQGQELYKASDAAARRKESDDFDAALLPIETSLFKSNGAGGVTMDVSPGALDAIQHAAAMPGAKQHPERIETLLTAMHTATQDQIDGKERTTVHDVYTPLSARIGSTTDPLTKAEVDEHFKDLSTSDYHFLREAASDSKSANPKINHAITELHRWQEQVKPLIDKSDPLAGSIDQSGAAQFSYMAWDSEAALRKAIAAGVDPDVAVQRLTDPRNPNGMYPQLPKYQTTNKQGLAGVLAATKPGGVQIIPAAPGGPAPRAKGESTADYLKRTQ